MTVNEAKQLNIGDTCKDLEKTNLYGTDVYCKVIEITDNDITFGSIDGRFNESFPWTIIFSQGKESLSIFEKIEN